MNMSLQFLPTDLVLSHEHEVNACSTISMENDFHGETCVYNIVCNVLLLVVDQWPTSEKFVCLSVRHGWTLHRRCKQRDQLCPAACWNLRPPRACDVVVYGVQTHQDVSTVLHERESNPFDYVWGSIQIDRHWKCHECNWTWGAGGPIVLEC